MSEPVRPTDDQLRRFLAGLLSDAEAESVGRWVESDPSAPSVLARLESADSLADALAEPSTRADHTTPGGAPPDPHAPPTLPDGYRLLGELGRGGMGVVYRAVDAEIDREVAVKVLAAHLPRRSGIEIRFRDEARITGQLQHPGIPPVYRVGELPDGRPFLAMKLIKGDTLADLLRRDPAGVNRLGVFEQVCQAVGYAHAHGVIHRDLKPSNVMVGTFGEVQVMDWGLAKVLAPLSARGRGVGGEGEATSRPTEIKSLRESDTRAGSVMGTPAFMAPEQAIGAADRLDRRTDVFGLGGILAVLLTGHPPYLGTDAEAVRQLAARAKLDDSYARLDGCGAEPELVALCKRCLSAEPPDRPADGQAVAAEVAALRAAADDRARRAEMDREKAVVEGREQRKRQRVLVWAAGAVAAVLVAGTGVSVWQMLRAMGAEGQATANAADAERSATEARGERDAKEKALQERTTALTQAEERGNILWSGLDAMTADLVGESLATQKAVSHEQRKFLTTVLPLYRQLARETGDDEAVRVRAARAALRVGAIEYRVGRIDEGAKAMRQACDGFARLASEHPAVPEYLLPLAASHSNLGVLLGYLGKAAEAEEECRKAVAIEGKLAAEYPAVPGYRRHLASGHTNLGNLLKNRGQGAEAEREYRTALAIQEKLAAEYPAVPDYRSGLAANHANLGLLLAGLGQRAEAEREYRAALGIQEKLASGSPAVPEYRSELALSHANLGNLLMTMGNMAEAEKQHRNALGIREKLVAEYPAAPGYRRDLAQSQANLGNLLTTQGKGAEAEGPLRTAQAVFDKLAAEYPAVPDYRRDLAASHTSLGNLLWGLGKRAEAERQCRKALAIQEKLAADFPAVPEYRHQLAQSHLNLGVLLKNLGQGAEAEEQYRKGQAVFEKLATDFPAVSDFRVALGGSYSRLGYLVRDGGRAADSLTCFNKAIDTLSPISKTDPRDPTTRQYLQNSHWGRATVYDELKRYKEAVKDWDRAVDLSPTEEQPQARVCRVASKLKAGQVEEAVAEVAELRKQPGHPPQVLAIFACVYAAASAKVPDEQKNYADQAVELLQKAVKAGFKNVAQLKAEKYLDPLRERDDFKKLLADLEKK